MKLLTSLSMMVASASANWYHGAPECAQDCLSSAYAKATITSGAAWPAASAYCDKSKGKAVGSCIQDKCQGDDKSVFKSYSTMSSSICSGYKSCTDAGNTGVRTYTYPAGPVTWAAPGGWDANSPTGASAAILDDSNTDSANYSASMNPSYSATGARGPGHNNGNYWSEWASAYSGSASWGGGAVTAAGCAGFGGSPWYVGPGCGWNGEGGFDGWMGWGEGWKWLETKTTETVTYTTTDSKGSQSTTVGPLTMAIAVSDGTYTQTSTLHQAQETGPSDSGDDNGDDQEGAAAGRIGGGGEGSIVTTMMGVSLAAIVVGAGLL